MNGAIGREGGRKGREYDRALHAQGCAPVSPEITFIVFQSLDLSLRGKSFGARVARSLAGVKIAGPGGSSLPLRQLRWQSLRLLRPMRHCRGRSVFLT